MFQGTPYFGSFYVCEKSINIIRLVKNDLIYILNILWEHFSSINAIIFRQYSKLIRVLLDIKEA